MRRKVTHSLLGVSLLAAVVAGAPTSVGAQGGWGGFSTTSVPSSLTGGSANTSPAWAAATTNDLGGAGVDLWVNNHAERSEALIDYNGGATVFANVQQSPLVGGSDTHGAAFTDVDDDGDEDLLEVAGRTHDSEIFLNNGGTLSIVAGPTGLEDVNGRGRQPLMVDIDNDGDMDVIIANLDRTEVPDPPTDPRPTELYLNDGDGTSWTKVDDPNDVISDGSLRLLSLTSTGPGTTPLVLTHSTFGVGIDSVATGTATLTEGRPVNPFLFAADNATQIRDVVLGDVDGDLSPEVIVARQQDFLGMGADGMGTDPSLEGELPLSIGNISTNGLDPSVLEAISNDALVDNCRSATLGDYDNDADLDIFAGCTLLESGQDKNVVLLNDGDGNFTISAAATPTMPTADTASVVINVDFNDDGWIDTYVGTGYDSQGGPDYIFLNDGGTSNHWLKIDLVDADNPDVMGAQVFVGTDKWQVRESGHRMHQGQDMKALHFGLGSQTDIAPVEIQWPDGTYETCTVSGIDRTVTITKGGAGCVDQTKTGLLAALDEDPNTGPPAKTCAGRAVTVDLGNGEVATQGNDVILGTEGDDIMNGLGGDDFMCGLGGNDVMSGGAGIDRMYGGDGRDDMNGGTGRDRMYGGAGGDTMFGGIQRDVMVGQKGLDTIIGEGGRDRINGSTGNDFVSGGGGDDQLKGGRGVDEVNGGRGTDSCRDFEVLNRCEV